MSDSTPKQAPSPAVSEYEMREKALNFAMTHRIGRAFGKTDNEDSSAAMTVRHAEEFLRFLQGQPPTLPPPGAAARQRAAHTAIDLPDPQPGPDVP